LLPLRLLEGYLLTFHTYEAKDQAGPYGSPQQRFAAMWRGEVDACVAMEPWIAGRKARLQSGV
jgi:hypothetical protein